MRLKYTKLGLKICNRLQLSTFQYCKKNVWKLRMNKGKIKNKRIITKEKVKSILQLKGYKQLWKGLWQSKKKLMKKLVRIKSKVLFRNTQLINFIILKIEFLVFLILLSQVNPNKSWLSTPLVSSQSLHWSARIKKVELTSWFGKGKIIEKKKIETWLI